MQASTLFQAIFVIALLGAVVWVTSYVADDWSDWVVFGVLILTVFGAARAVFFRKYPTKKRTFIRSSGPDDKRPS